MIIPFLLLFSAVVLSGVALFVYPSWHRRRVLRQPVPHTWLRTLDTRLPWLRALTRDERRQLLDRMRLFLDEKQFHGCAGLEVTVEMRVVIAAQACLLLFNREGGVFPTLRHVLLYPAMFSKEQEEHNDDGTVSAVHQQLLGESWAHGGGEGKVLLSWEDVEHDLEHPDDGENVVLHEFAHQLDAENGSDNGAPILRHNDAARWEKVMAREFKALGRAVAHGKHTFLDPYAASAPAEFFAVLTETYFEQAEQLRDWHPELYAELREYYRVDPARWR
ncbi:MAG: zinc-dependent peptidase [Pseudomonadales bacterium]|jgi:Mlc titration factor MtfA (ptsG expression regulator)|nr:zinc-dependent peptidase [Pseudomonadales bacterium]